jgi:23S rRNA (adenine2503-C2)-methyltransferase
MEKQNLLGYTIEQCEQLMVSLGEQPYRGRQLFKWLYSTRQYDFDLMSDISKSVRSTLDEKYEFRIPKMVESQKSSDGTEKFLFHMDDSSPVETVLIPDDNSDRKTVCISSQVGCALACKFCATGTMGMVKDLSVGEILGQLIYLRDNFGDNAFSNVVMMGMGEPLNNFENVCKMVKIATAPTGMAFSGKKITISTSGISPKIKKLADSGLKARLAVSLHAATQEKREKLMPVAKTFKLDKLFEAIKYYTDKTGYRITFEYIIFKDFNDSMEDVLALSKLIRGIPCKINLLAYNPVDGLDFERPSDEKVNWFGKKLYPRAPAVTVRKSRGRDIDAACGQLAAKQK